MPHQLENNSQTILSAKQRFFLQETRKKQRSSTHKLLNNSATPTAQTTFLNDICKNKKHMPVTTLHHTLKPLPARCLQVQRAAEVEPDQGFLRLAIFDCSDNTCQRTNGCMRAVTHHRTSVVSILPNIMSRERLGTHSQGATSRLVVFSFLRVNEKGKGTCFNDCVQALLTESGSMLMALRCIQSETLLNGVHQRIPHRSTSIARQRH